MAEDRVNRRRSWVTIAGHPKPFNGRRECEMISQTVEALCCPASASEEWQKPCIGRWGPVPLVLGAVIIIWIIYRFIS